MERSLTLDGDFTLADVVEKMVASEQNWMAFSRFATRVMRIKEEAERVREREGDPRPHRRVSQDNTDEWDSG